MKNFEEINRTPLGVKKSDLNLRNANAQAGCAGE